MKIIMLALVVFMVIGSGIALAQEYLPGETFGQISPDRVLVERERHSLVPNEAYAPYTPTARYAFGDVSGQISPDRALASRLEAGTEHLVTYMPFTAQAKYAPWCVCEQVSPDRVLAERVACGICTF